MSEFSLTKNERVRSLKLIDQLFGKNTPAFVAQGFRVSWVQTNNTLAPCSVLFLSPKKKLKLAHDRNRRKRVLKELYRLNKGELVKYLSAQSLFIAISINYVGIEPLDMTKHSPAFKMALNKLILELQKNYPISIHPAN